jgi:hypothetical protein
MRIKLTIGQTDLIRKLRQLPELKDATNVRIFVRVPGSGDYSNTDLDIEDGCPLFVEFDRNLS